MNLNEFLIAQTPGFYIMIMHDDNFVLNYKWKQYKVVGYNHFI